MIRLEELTKICTFMTTKKDGSEEKRNDETSEEKNSSEVIMGKFSGVKHNPHTVFCMITENFYG